MHSPLLAPRFCPFCGTPLHTVEADKGFHPGCGTCGYVWFPDPKVAACVYAVIDDRLLLVKRVRPPAGLWCLPGGFVNASETPESAVTRELLEETNLEIAAPVLQAVYADTERGVLLITFAAAIVGGTIALDPDECADARFFARSELPSEDELAFETGRTAIIAWRDRRSPLH